MAAQSPPFALQASSHSAELFRRAISSMVTAAGVVNPLTDLKVTQNTGTDLKVQVSAGQIWIPGTLGSSTGFSSNRTPTIVGAGAAFTSQGMYYGFNDAAITGLSLSAANATNPRIDLICATVLDAQYSGATNSFVIQVVTGTASSSPAYPAIPANSFVLATVSVAANQTTVVNANIADDRAQCIMGIGGGNTQNLATASVGASESTTSSSPTDLTTPGPAVSIYVPSSGTVLVTLSASFANGTAGDYCGMFFVASGANTVATSNSQALIFQTSGTFNPVLSSTYPLTGLAAGLTTFTAKYSRPGGSGTSTFGSRRLTVQALP